MLKKQEKESQNLLNSYTSEEQQYLKETFSEVYNDFFSEIINGDYVFETKFHIEIQRVLDLLRKNNPIIPKKINIFVSKDNQFNAYCLFDGALIVNMGAFYDLVHEEQLAAILSHELSHFLLNHNTKMQLRILKSIIDNKKNVKEIQNQKYNKNQKTFDLYKKHLYESGEYRRKN